MSFYKHLKKYIPLQEIQKNLDEIERYLDDKSEDMEDVLKKVSIKKAKIKKPKSKSKVDSQWMIKTASKKIKIATRKWSRRI
ncbi:hypothetical protein [Petroclostridium sp. X23]|uniref:hypothetical protein n=1 Tax=Petroclostridium sp. X23 TaxID=3045146 RepID=UPI0024AD9BD2|nr:hypothetical protein [Petroclostridium sp. X23]WHH57049.1 hypothetical protein QKW49_14505 [Petroclostridium sp. X23]